MNVAELLAGLSERFHTEIPLTAFDQQRWASPASVVSEVSKLLRM
jgi:acyl carrier protein